MTTSKNNPLHYFDKLAETNSLISRKDSAINLLIEKFGDSIEFVDYEKGIVKYMSVFSDGSKDPIEAIATYNFSKEFTAEIIKESKKVKDNIDNTVIEINKNGNNANQFLISQAKLLSNLVEKSKPIYPNLKFIEDALQDIINYLVDKYSIKESYKRRNLDFNNKFSFFDIKSEVKRSKLVEIYDATVDLEIIDDEIITEETFLNVLMGNPTASNDVIIFKCNNQLTAHFITCIQPLFNNLTVSQIHKSRSFLNKSNVPFNQQGLDNANSLLRKKSSHQIDRITNHISRILNP